MSTPEMSQTPPPPAEPGERNEWLEHGASMPDQPLIDTPQAIVPPAPAPAYPPASAVTTVPDADLALPLARGLRLRTIVFGLLLAFVAVSVPLTHYTSVHLDGTAVAIGALIVTGVLLLVGGLASVARERRLAR